MSLANTDFHDYVLSLSPVLYRSFLGGDLNARDVYNRATTPATTSKWHRRKAGHGIRHCSVPTMVADGVEQQGLVGTLFVESGKPIESTAANQYQELFSKASAVGERWRLLYLRIGANRVLQFIAGGVGSNFVYDYREGGGGFAVTFQSSTAPSFFIDGVFRAVGTLASGAFVSPTATINIGARWNNTYPVGAPIHVVIQFPSILTDEQISDLHHLYLEDARGVPTAPARTISLPKRDLNGALLYLAGPKNATGDVVDYSGNGLDAAVTGRVGEQREHVSGAQVQRFHGAGAGVVTVPASALLTGHVGQTYSGLVRTNGDGEAGSGRILSTDIGGVVNTELLTRNANDLRFSRLYADGQADWDVAVRPGNGLPYHLVVRHDGDPTHLPTGLINGRAMAFAVSTGRTGALTSDVGADTKFGNRDALDRTLNGVVGFAKLHGANLTDEQARVEYLQHATRAIELAPRRAYPVTLTDVTAGQCGPWDCISGTWSYQDDGTRRRLICTQVDSTCLTPSKQAYGTWYWRSSKVDSSYHRVAPILSLRSEAGVAGQNGYVVYLLNNEAVVLYRFTGVATAVLFTTGAAYIAPDTEYEWFLTRAFDGYFALWIRGGVYTTWTLVDTVEDNMHTTSNFVSFQTTRVNDTLSDFVSYPLGDTLDPRTEVPGLED